MACNNGVCSVGDRNIKSGMQALGGNMTSSTASEVSGLKNPSFFKGVPAQNLQLQRFTQPQQSVLNQLLQLASQKLGQNLNQPTAQYPNPQSLARFNQPFDFAPIEKQARLGFERETVPSIAERFTAMGNNALSSGAFASQLGQAGSSLEHSLAALKANVGREDLGREQNLAQRLYELQFGRAQNDEQSRMALLQNLLGTGLTPQNENIFMPQQSSGFRQLLGGAAQALPHAIAAYFSGGSSLPASIASGGFSGALGQGNSGFGNSYGGLTGLASTANYGLPSTSRSGMGQAMYPGQPGLANSSLYPGLANLNRPF